VATQDSLGTQEHDFTAGPHDILIEKDLTNKPLSELIRVSTRKKGSLLPPVSICIDAQPVSICIDAQPVNICIGALPVFLSYWYLMLYELTIWLLVLSLLLFTFFSFQN